MGADGSCIMAWDPALLAVQTPAPVQYAPGMQPPPVASHPVAGAAQHWDCTHPSAFMLQHHLSKPLPTIKDESHDDSSFNSCGSCVTHVNPLQLHPTLNQPGSTVSFKQHATAEVAQLAPAYQLSKLVSGTQMELEQFAALCACADDHVDQVQ
jgi:hypothetical protein